MKKQLLPCPFCGGEARLTRFRFAMAAKYMVQCVTCAADFYLDSLKEVRARWNRRVSVRELPRRRKVK